MKETTLGRVSESVKMMRVIHSEDENDGLRGSLKETNDAKSSSEENRVIRRSLLNGLSSAVCVEGAEAMGGWFI